MAVSRKRRKHLVPTASLVAISLVLLALPGPVLMAQDNNSNSNANENKGPTASELFSGSSTSISGGLSLDSSIGWNFTQHFGINVGVPYLFLTRPGIFAVDAGRLGYVSTPSSGCTFFFGCYLGYGNAPRIWAGELADVYAEVHYARTYKKYDFLTVATGDAPTASFRKGLTSGRAQWDWFNHIDTDLHGFTPFVNFGLANGRMDQHFLPRPFNIDLPFRTLGYMADGEAGLEYKLWRLVSISGSFWDVLPFGPQKIYSELVWKSAGTPILDVGSPSAVVLPATTPTPAAIPGIFGYTEGDPNHGRYWNTVFEAVGPNYIDRDNGYSGTLTFSPMNWISIQVGYNHSVRYALDETEFAILFNVNSVFRRLTNY